MSKEKETIEDAKEAHEAHRQLISINQESLLDKLFRIGTGQSVDLSEDGSGSSFIDTSADRSNAEAHHIDFDSVFEKFGHTVSPKKQVTAEKKPPVDFGDLTPLIKEIATFKFSSNRSEEIGVLREAVSKEMRNIVSQRIINNTRKVSSEVHQFFRIKDGGMRVEFALLNRKFSMVALGSFRGDEYLCWNATGNKIAGHVMRLDDDGNFSNVNEEFNITVCEGWKK